VRVTTADLQNGLLSIDLVREIPEAMKPRRIEIGTAKSLGENNNNPVQIEAPRAA
jgi:molecular chaperone IbpA